MTSQAASGTGHGSPHAPRIVAVVSSPSIGGSTAAVTSHVLAGAHEAGARVQLVELGDTSAHLAAEAIGKADGVILGSPVYRATYNASMAQLLECVEREGSSPLRAKPVAVVITAGAPEHFVACERLTAVLTSFFAAICLPQASFFTSADFEAGALAQPARKQCERLGFALHDLAIAVRESAALRALRPTV